MKSVDGFTIQGRLGAGGFAVAWAATREEDGAPAVLKVGRAATPVLVERFRREAAAMERVGPPHTPRLYARGSTAEGLPYLAMERLSGETLAERLAREPRPPALAWVARVAGSILAALEITHARGLVHRDLKPENIFLAGAEPRAVLLDFGLARRTDADEADLTRSGVVVGTPHYMAPEQIAGEREIGPPADLYAFGIVLYELLTLQLPFAGEPGAVEHGHLALRPRPPSERAPVPRALEALVLACLSKEPDRRPPSATEVRRALAAAAEEAPAPPPRLAAPAEARRAGPHPGPRADGPRHASGPRLLAEGRHPVVLAAIESDGDARGIAEAVARHGGLIARQRGRRYLAVFSGHAVEDPARAARAAARAITADQGARAALHLAPVTLRRREGAALAVYGPAVERPEAWMPAEPWSGVHLTLEIEAALPDERASGPAAETHEIAPGVTGARSEDARLGPPILGRDDALTALEQSARTSLVERRPALFTILGDHGLGKTRLAREVAAIARRLSPEALIVPLQPPPGGDRGLADDLRRGLGDGGADRRDAESHAGALAEALHRRAREGPVTVILDDAQWAEPELLDALELATIDGAGIRLWVVLAAHPRFELARPGWGARTRSHGRATLEPLAEPAAMSLAAELIRPAEYPPADALARLARWSGGNPASLAEIARTLKRAGVVRRRPGAASWYIATADLDALPPSPAWQWIAARRLSTLPPELAALARLCAVLGVSFGREELEHVQAALERAGRAATPVDVGFGLRALVDVGILARVAAGRFAFQDALLRDALHEMIDPAQRAAVHEHALGYWRGRADLPATGPGTLEGLARHAAACGRLGEAAAAHLRLGDLAFAQHRHVDADQRYTAALSLLPDEEPRRRAAALMGRGRSRYRIGRAREAQEDLVEARRIAGRLGDRALEARLLLEEATALDWLREFAASTACVAEARTILRELEDPGLSVRLLVAEGRTSYRRGEATEAIARLREALAAAAAQGDSESRSVALLLLAPQLASAGEVAEAEARFEELITSLTELGDGPHLVVAYVNRTTLWYTLRDPERAVADLTRAMAMARRIGDPMLERLAACNVSDSLYCAGRAEEALEIAQRACLLEERFFPRPVAWGRINLARALAMLDRHEEAREIVVAIDGSRPTDLEDASRIAPSLRALLAMLRLILAEAGVPAAGAGVTGTWADLLAATEQILPADEVLEVLYWQARTALRGGRRDHAEEARRRALRLDPSNRWLHHLDALLTPAAPAPAAPPRDRP